MAAPQNPLFVIARGVRNVFGTFTEGRIYQITLRPSQSGWSDFSVIDDEGDVMPARWLNDYDVEHWEKVNVNGTPLTDLPTVAQWGVGPNHPLLTVRPNNRPGLHYVGMVTDKETVRATFSTDDLRAFARNILAALDGKE